MSFQLTMKVEHRVIDQFTKDKMADVNSHQNSALSSER